MLFKPTVALDKVHEISPELLKELNVKALILDLDNTLTTHDNPRPAEKVTDWIQSMRTAGIKLMIVSNNHAERVKPFAEMLGLEFVSEGKKPRSKGFREAQKRLCMPFSEIAIVGDQIFTDILGANLIRVKSIFVFPIEYENTTFFKIKRAIEKPLLPKKLYQQKN